MVVPRSGAASVLLPNGQVLVAGGVGSDHSPLASAEVYSPATGSWSLTGSMLASHAESKLYVLYTNQVLLIDGNLMAGDHCELYDPIAGTWSVAPRPFYSTGRTVLLSSGNVLDVEVGTSSQDQHIEIYDAILKDWTNDFILEADPDPDYSGPSYPALVMQANGDVLAIGGWTDEDATFPSLAVFGGFAGFGTSFSSRSPLIARVYPGVATLLQDGKILVAGGLGSSRTPGLSDSAAVAASEIYDPAADRWSAAGTLNTARTGATALVLSSGRVLLLDGDDRSGSGAPLNIEMFDPSTAAWHVTAAPAVPRSAFAATKLADGRVLIAGGRDGAHAVLGSAEVYDENFAAIRPSFTGAWYDPAQNGHGVFLEILPGNQVFFGWFTFTSDGTQQAWFGGLGTYSGNTASIPVVDLPTGGRWIPNFDPAEIRTMRGARSR